MSENHHVVITGGTRGIGEALAKEFLSRGWKVTISGSSSGSVANALSVIDHPRLAAVVADVTQPQSAHALWDQATEHHGAIDIWVNNAGVNQTSRYLWEIDPAEVERVVVTDLVGAMYGAQVAVTRMIQQGHGTVFTMEGHGSNGSIRPRLSLYGTAKRGVSYFSSAMARELAHAYGKRTAVRAGIISPGIVLTDFTLESLDERPEDVDRVKWAFNVLGELPETVASYLVPRMIRNRKNGAAFRFLTTPRVLWKFLTAGPRQRRNLVGVAQKRRLDRS